MASPAEDNVIQLNLNYGPTEIQQIPLPGPTVKERNEVWDSCVEVLGYEPQTDSEKALWAKRTKSLASADATWDRIQAVAKWYHRRWPDIDLTISALEKWYSHFLRLEEKRLEKKPSCDECGLGGGQHIDGCSLSSTPHTH